MPSILIDFDLPSAILYGIYLILAIINKVILGISLDNAVFRVKNRLIV